MPESPTSSNSDHQEPQKSRLSLRPKLKAPSQEPSSIESTADSDQSLKSTELDSGTTEVTPSPKPKLKIGLKNPNADSDSNTRPTSQSEASPINPPSESPEQESNNTEKPQKLALKLKDIHSLTPHEKSEDITSSNQSTPPPVPTEDSDPAKTDRPPFPLSTDDLPFTLPKAVKGPPPLLPLEENENPQDDPRTRKDALPETRPTITFDELEPAHSKKAPPPINAPVHKGKVRKGKKKYLLLALALFICAGLFYQFYWAPQNAAQPEIFPTIHENTSTTAPLPPPVKNANNPSSIPQTEQPPIETTTIPESPETIETTPDPLIASIVDNLAITLVKSTGSNPMIAINNIAYPVGSIVDESTQLTFIGFDLERREIIFEAPNRSRYFRYY